MLRNTELHHAEEKGKKGLEQGIEKGSRESKIEMAKVMLEDEPLEKISKYTSLSIKEIQKISE